MYLGNFVFLEKVCLPLNVAAHYNLTEVQEDAGLMGEAALEIQEKGKTSAVFLPIIDEFVPRLAGVNVTNSFEKGTLFPETAGQSLKNIVTFSFKINQKEIAAFLEAVKILKAQKHTIIIKLPDLPLILSTIISQEEMVRAPRQQPDEFDQWALKLNELIFLYAKLLEESGADYLSFPLTQLSFFGKKFYRQHYLDYYKHLLTQLASLEKVKLIVNNDAVNLLDLEIKPQKENLTAIVDDVKLDGIYKIMN